MLMKAIKDFVIQEKDYAGRRIDDVIYRLALQTGTSLHDWSYLREDHIYQNTVTGMCVYPHEVARKAS